MNDPAHLGPFAPGQQIILLAEDDVMIRNVARLTLQSAGYGILTADDGVEALSLSRRFSGPIHLLLTDILMPKMSGLELCAHFQVERPDTALLVMSGTHHPGTEARFLSKPFSPAELRRVVEEVLQRKQIGYTAD